MATTIFPQSGDAGSEEAFSGIHAFTEDRVLGDDDMKPTDAGGLDFQIAAGEAILNGMHVAVDSAVTLTAPDNTNSYVYLKLSRTSGKVDDPASDSDNYVVSSSTQTGDDYLPIAFIATSGGDFDEFYDLRKKRPGPVRTVIKETTEARTSQSYLADPDLRIPVRPDRLYKVDIKLLFDKRPEIKLRGVGTFNVHAISWDDSGFDVMHWEVSNNEQMDNFSSSFAGIILITGFLDTTGARDVTVYVEWTTRDGDAELRAGSSFTLTEVR